ncbi:MAG: hypothetical protein QOD77_2181 [Thermoplasmata archaeon]|jgi:hypothetical protein|nr:hypothetical protein [Thermoplasmata archaeon]
MQPQAPTFSASKTLPAVALLLAFALAGCSAAIPDRTSTTTQTQTQTEHHHYSTTTVQVPAATPPPPPEPEPEPVPVPEPAPPRLESFNRTFNLTVSAPSLSRDDLTPAGSGSACLLVRWPQDSPATILNGTYRAAWESQSPFAERLNLTIAPEDGPEAWQVAASPLNQTFDGLTGTTRFRLGLDGVGVAYGQEVRATLAFHHYGAAPTVIAHPCDS